MSVVTGRSLNDDRADSRQLRRLDAVLFLALGLTITTATVSTALAQATADGTTVDLTAGTAACDAQVCFEALNGGTINSNGNAVGATVTDDPGFPTSHFGAYADDGGTINLLDGDQMQLGANSIGLATDTTGTNAITATGLSFTGQNAQNFVRSLGATSSIVLNGTTNMQGSAANDVIRASGNGAVVTVNGPVQADLSGPEFAAVVGGGRIDFKDGGNVTLTGGTLFGASNNTPPQGTSVITLTGMTASLTGNSSVAELLSLSSRSDIVATNSSIQGTNAGGTLYGIRTVLPGTARVTLDATSLTLNSAGSGIRVSGNSTTVTLRNGAAITAFANGADNSLAEITNLTGFADLDGPGSLTLKATDSTLSGNVLVDAPGPEGANRFTARLRGSTQFTGDVTVGGTPSTADIALSGSAQWTGTATDVTNVSVGSGATWTVTGDVSVTDTLSNGGTVAFQWDGAFHTLSTTNYTANSTLGLNTKLGGNASPTDQLIIDGGTASGSTQVQVTNRGGTGALTSGNGIQVVAAENGATTAANAFSLAGPVAAGHYQYELRRGEGSAEAQQSWYLANHTTPPPPPCPSCPQPQPVPIYRPEASAYAVLPAMARAQSLAALGTFHERQGDQGLVRGGSNDRAWGRVFAQRTEQQHEGLLTARFDGDMSGLQVGLDALRFTSPSGYETTMGLSFAYAHSEGDAYGHNLGLPDNFAGKPELDGASVGAYWTRIGPRGGYVDAVAMATHYDSSGHSTNNVEIDADGTGLMASLEAGYPIALGYGLTLEPQAQAIYQHLAFDNANDPFSTVDFDTPDAVVGRLGLRLTGAFGTWRPYLKANLWQDWVEEDTALYAGVHTVDSEHASTALELGGGVAANLGPRWGLWLDAAYTQDISGEEREVVRGTAGLRVLW